MTAHYDARKAAEAATEIRAAAYDLTDVEHRRFVRDAVAAAAPILLAADRARIAAAIRAAGHPDGYHRVDTTREWAGIYCADCAVTERSARIAETAPEGDPPCPTCGHPMTVHDVNEGWICKRHPRIAETAPEEGP